VDLAELVTLDLPLLNQTCGLEDLAKELKYAAYHVGKQVQHPTSTTNPLT
jgi:hypothetical protein